MSSVRQPWPRLRAAEKMTVSRDVLTASTPLHSFSIHARALQSQ